jgi:uncharacterized membrane protein
MKVYSVSGFIFGALIGIGMTAFFAFPVWLVLLAFHVKVSYWTLLSYGVAYNVANSAVSSLLGGSADAGN